MIDDAVRQPIRGVILAKIMPSFWVDKSLIESFQYVFREQAHLEVLQQAEEPTNNRYCNCSCRSSCQPRKEIFLDEVLDPLRPKEITVEHFTDSSIIWQTLTC